MNEHEAAASQSFGRPGRRAVGPDLAHCLDYLDGSQGYFPQQVVGERESVNELRVGRDEEGARWAVSRSQG